MEFLTVGNVKLKIILDPAESREYGIDGAGDGELSPEVRLSVRRLLSTAADTVAFFTAGERLLIQIYPIPKGGAELFVTKLSAIPERERRAITESGILTYLSRGAYYKFSDLKTLSRVGRILKERECDLYLGHDGDYYLAIDEGLVGELSDCDVLSEYGERIHRLPLGISGEWGCVLLSSRPLSDLSN